MALEVDQFFTSPSKATVFEGCIWLADYVLTRGIFTMYLNCGFIECLLQLQANEALSSELDNLKCENLLLVEERQLNKTQVCISYMADEAANEIAL